MSTICYMRIADEQGSKSCIKNDSMQRPPCFGEAGLAYLYPITSLFVFFRYFAGIASSRRQVMFIGFSPSCRT